MLRKSFNITGVCIPDEHYMVDTTKKLNEIIKLINNNKYFTINRARQYGKTTTLSLLTKALKDQYLVIRVSFEGADDLFDSLYTLSKGFVELSVNSLIRYGIPQNIINDWTKPLNTDTPLLELNQRISSLIKNSGKHIILMIDEVDKSSNNQIFLSFLGMLRTKYLDAKEGFDVTFKSVILAGVYDIKNLKKKMHPDEEPKYNSPWNIASDFLVDMSFNPEEISTMLEDYEKDTNTGMDVHEISEELYRYTGGYPFLISKLCKMIDENNAFDTELNKGWTLEGIRNTVKKLLKETNTLFDDMVKNLENNDSFRILIERILIGGEDIPFGISNPEISLGVMFGILKNVNDKVAVSNIIFESYIYNHLILRHITGNNSFNMPISSQFIKNGILDMEKVLIKFQELMKSEYRKSDQKFLEKQGRLLFLCFLKPIINGNGHYVVESQTRENTRMDIVVFYGEVKFIIELKIWHGKKKNAEAYDQLSEYLENMSQNKGYLVNFSFNKTNSYKPVRTNYKDKEIFEITI